MRTALPNTPKNKACQHCGKSLDTEHISVELADEIWYFCSLACYGTWLHPFLLGIGYLIPSNQNPKDDTNE